MHYFSADLRIFTKFLQTNIFVKSRIKCNRRQSFISTRNSRYSNEGREREEEAKTMKRYTTRGKEDEVNFRIIDKSY